VREIRDLLAARRARAYTTIMTIMDRLARKGVVERRKAGRAYVYRPKLSAEVARAQALAQVVENFFGGSKEALLAELDAAQGAPELLRSNRFQRAKTGPPSQPMFPRNSPFATWLFIPPRFSPHGRVTDTVFRRVIRSLGNCGLIMTEFTSAEGSRAKLRVHFATYTLRGRAPHRRADLRLRSKSNGLRGALTEDLGFDQIDINLGCPVKKVVKCGGSGLLRDLPHLEKLLREVRSAVRIPLTIKIRSGWTRTTSSPSMWRAWPRPSASKLSRSIRVRECRLRWVRRLECDSGGEAGGEHSGHRQWRRSRAERRRAHDRRDGLRCGDDRPCASSNPWIFRQIATISPPAALSSQPKKIATSCCPRTSATSLTRKCPTPWAR